MGTLDPYAPGNMGNPGPYFPRNIVTCMGAYFPGNMGTRVPIFERIWGPRVKSVLQVEKLATQRSIISLIV